MPASATIFFHDLHTRRALNCRWERRGSAPRWMQRRRGAGLQLGGAGRCRGAWERGGVECHRGVHVEGSHDELHDVIAQHPQCFRPKLLLQPGIQGVRVGASAFGAAGVKRRGCPNSCAENNRKATRRGGQAEESYLGSSGGGGEVEKANGRHESAAHRALAGRLVRDLLAGCLGLRVKWNPR